MEIKERTGVAKIEVWSNSDRSKHTYLIDFLTHVPETRYGLKCIDSGSSKNGVVIATFERHRLGKEGNYRCVLLDPLKTLELETYERAAIDEAFSILNSDKDLDDIRSEHGC